MFDLKYSLKKRAVGLARFASCARDTFLAVVRHRFGGGPAPVKMLLLSDGSTRTASVSSIRSSATFGP